MSRLVASILSSALLLAGCEKKQPWPQPPREGAARAVDVYQCNRCHVAEPGVLQPIERDHHCVDCHNAVFDGAFDGDYSPARIEGWREKIVHLRAVPSLVGAGARFERDWLVAFLQNPHDLRPRLGAEMPRFAMSKADAEAISDYLLSTSAGRPPEAEPPSGDVRAGVVALGERGCMTCHAFTGSPEVGASAIPVEVGAAQLAAAMKLAPDLRYTRERMSRAAVFAWLEDPSSLKSDALMPKIPLTDTQRRDITAALFDAPLAEPRARAVPARLPVLERPVRHAEVERRVFKKVCWHCHSDPEPVGGDGGPGNTGGFGFDGKGIDLGSKAAILAGGRRADGSRIDLFEVGGGGAPKLVEHMMARHVEVAGGRVDGVLGMPLGLPPMTLEEIQLVETWIVQGAR